MNKTDFLNNWYARIAFVSVVLWCVWSGFSSLITERQIELASAGNALHVAAQERAGITQSELSDLITSMRESHPNIEMSIHSDMASGAVVFSDSLSVSYKSSALSPASLVVQVLFESWLFIALGALWLVLASRANPSEENLEEQSPLENEESLVEPAINDASRETVFDISHNIRTNLANMYGFIQQLRCLNLSRRQAEIVTRIMDTTDMVDAGARELTAFVNMDEDTVIEKAHDSDLFFTLENVMNAVAPALDRKNLYADLIVQEGQRFNVRSNNNVFYHLANNFVYNALLIATKNSGFIVRLAWHNNEGTDKSPVVELSVEFPDANGSGEGLFDAAENANYSAGAFKLLPAATMRKWHNTASKHGCEIGERLSADGNPELWAHMPFDQMLEESSEQLAVINRMRLCDLNLDILIADDRKSFLESMSSRLAYINLKADVLDTSVSPDLALNKPSYDIVYVRNASQMPDDGQNIKVRANAGTLISMEQIFDESALNETEGLEPINLAMTTFSTLPRLAEYLNYFKIDLATKNKADSIATKPASVMPNLSMLAGKPLADVDILVVEDNKTNQKLLKQGLELKGASVTLASTGEEGIKLATEQRFNLVLLDLHMPDLGGVEVGGAIRAQGPNQVTPIIGISADPLASDHKTFANVVNDVVTNKGEIDQLTDMIMRYHHQPMIKAV